MEAGKKDLDALGVRILAASVDGEQEILELKRKADLSFRIAFGVDPKIVEALGAWAGERQGRTYIQPCEFVLRPDGHVAASMYGSTQLGRMDPAEVAQFLKSRV